MQQQCSGNNALKSLVDSNWNECTREASICRAGRWLLWLIDRYLCICRHGEARPEDTNFGRKNENMRMVYLPLIAVDRQCLILAVPASSAIRLD